MRWQSWVVAVLVATALGGCQDASTPTHPLEATEPTARTPSPAPEESGGPAGPMTIRDPDVVESSGLALSHLHPGVLYTHNDLGAPPEIFAVDRDGTRATLLLDVDAVDWEDIASTPDGRLWVADTGDNDEQRESVSVQVVEEPDELASGSLQATTYELRYPDGPHDAEALLVDPRDMRVYLVTKASDGGRVYAAPAVLDPVGVNILTEIGEAPPNVTAGDFAPDGLGLVLRNQGRAFFYSELGGTPTVVGLPPQPQGESATFTADGAHVLLGSEGPASTVIEIAVPELEG